MDKRVDIIKNSVILFVVNIIILLGTLFFKSLYTIQGYFKALVNIIFIINLIILVVGIIFNVIFLKFPKKYNDKKYLVVIISSFIAYLLINTIFIISLNKCLNSGYTKINNQLSSYCDTFVCDKYETISDGKYKKFIIENIYFDYNNNENNIKITTTYNTDEVIKVVAEIYSDNEMFSETLIKDNLKDYFSNFKYDIDESLIKKAFDKGFDGLITSGNASYKVTEIYKENNLEKIKTTITLNLKQE